MLRHELSRLMNLHLDILPPAQRAYWDRFSGIPPQFVLYGDTAIALQLGHRQSVDFDFFARENFDPQQLMADVDWLADAKVVSMAANTLTVRVGADEPVLVSFFGVPRLPELRQPHWHANPGVALGALLELAGMKAMVVQKRAEAKDYVDLHALMQHGQLDLPTALAATSHLYAPHFAPEWTLRALCHFKDGNLDSLPRSLRKDLVRAVKAVDVDALPTLDPVIAMVPR